MNSRLRTALVAAVTTALVAASAGPAEAAAKATVVYSSDTYITQRFAVHDTKIAVLACATVTEVRAGGTDQALPYPGCTPRVEDGGGVAYSHDGATTARTITLHHTVSGPPPAVDTRLYLTRGGEHLPSIDIGSYEGAANPDGPAYYGARSTSSCVARGLGGDAGYQGRLDSALRSVAAGPGQSWYIADRDGNTLYRVDEAGRLSVLAVLPPVTVTVSQALARRAGWPSCVVGTEVAFEPAPGEVEVGPDGTVYVAGQPALQSGVTSTSSVLYAISPTTKRVRTLAQRYSGSVDLAVGTNNRLFAAHPQVGRVSVIVKGKSSTYLSLSRVLAVETDDRGRLYAVRGSGTDPVETPGTVVRIS